MVLLFELTDGRIARATLAPNGRRPGESEEMWIDRARSFNLEKVPALKGATFLQNAIVPSNMHFRDCWRNDGTGKVHVDMPLARTQRMEEIRTERDKQLADSDGPMARANEIGYQEEIDALKTKRQVLREIPQNIDMEAITKPEELEAFEPNWPDKP